MGMKILLTGLLVLLSVPHAWSAETLEIYISQEGNDMASGSVKEPVQSFEKALEISRKFNGAKTINLAEGTHFLSKTIQLDGRDEDLYILGRNKATLSGGEIVSGWKIMGNGLWKAKVPVEGSPRELFVNGKRATRARFPNKDWLRIEKSLPDRRTGFSFNQEDLPKSLNPSEGLELVFLHDWSISRIPVASIDHSKQILKVKFPIGCEAPHYAIDHFEKHPRYALEGSLALLDQAGEWAIQDGYIYYKPLEGETIELTETIVPRLSKLLEIAPGKDGKQPEDINFRWFTFAHCRWDVPPNGYASGQASMHEWRNGSGKKGRTFIPAAVEVSDSKDIWFHGVKFKHLGGSGLWIRGESQYCDVSICEFSDISGNGLNIGELGASKIAKRISCRTSSVHHCGVQYFGSVGIWIGMASNCSVVRTEVYDLPYTGISLGWKWDPTPTPCEEHGIGWNHIHNVLQILSDGGGIYTLGRQPGTILFKNYIHDIPLNMGRAQSNGIFMDQGSSEITVNDNIITNIAKSPIRFHQAAKNTIKDNHLRVGKDTPAFTFNRTDSEIIDFYRNKIYIHDTEQSKELIKEWLNAWDDRYHPKTIR